MLGLLLLCTITFRGQPQGSKWGPAVAKAGTAYGFNPYSVFGWIPEFFYIIVCIVIAWNILRITVSELLIGKRWRPLSMTAENTTLAKQIAIANANSSTYCSSQCEFFYLLHRPPPPSANLKRHVRKVRAKVKVKVKSSLNTSLRRIGEWPSKSIHSWPLH
jgi:hypothetical protein